MPPMPMPGLGAVLPPGPTRPTRTAARPASSGVLQFVLGLMAVLFFLLGSVVFSGVSVLGFCVTWFLLSVIAVASAGVGGKFRESGLAMAGFVLAIVACVVSGYYLVSVLRFEHAARTPIKVKTNRAATGAFDQTTYELKVMACKIDPSTQVPIANGTIVNKDSVSRSFWLNVGYLDKDGLRYASDDTYVLDLSPGTATLWASKANGLGKNPPAPAHCVVTVSQP